MNTKTKDFQSEVSKKLTVFFDNQVRLIKDSSEWENIDIEYLNLINSSDFQVIDRRYTSCDEIFDDFNLPENEATTLFIANLIAANEVNRIREQIRLTQNRNKKILRLEHLLECCSEPSTYYYENSGECIPIDYPKGKPIYSPILDIAIAPSMHLGANRRNSFITNYPLHNGQIMFEALSRLNFIKNLKRKFEIYCVENYKRIGLEYKRMNINSRPLCLFGIEIENQKDKKHLMGDFVNSVLLSKYPVIVIPDRILDECLSMLKLTKVIKELKDVNIYELLNKAIVLNVSQFRNAIDSILIVNNIEPLGVQEFN